MRDAALIVRGGLPTARGSNNNTVVGGTMGGGDVTYAGICAATFVVESVGRDRGAETASVAATGVANDPSHRLGAVCPTMTCVVARAGGGRLAASGLRPLAAVTRGLEPRGRRRTSKRRRRWALPLIRLGLPAAVAAIC